MDALKYRPYLIIAASWTAAFFLVQAGLLYHHRGTALLSPGGNTPGFGNVLSSPTILFGATWFLMSVIALHIAFAWLNLSSFNSLLAPRLPLERTRMIALVAQLFLVTLTLCLLNAWLYPRSLLGSHLDLLLTIPSGRIILLCLTVATSVYIGVGAALGIARSRRLRTVFFIALSITTLYATAQFLLPVTAKRPPTDRPDVIVIGVDSLRPDHLTRNGAPFNLMPHLERALSESTVFTDTLSPQAHTFPATVSILTGQWPNRHGARANLFPEDRIDVSSSIAHDFADVGYTTLIGMDETRFANIDERYGFEQLLGPSMGLLDFLMSAVSDNILTNLMVNSPIGEFLFPVIHGNRAIDHVYSPTVFSRQVRRAIRGLPNDKPAFIYLHFCAGHWPYRRGSLYRHEPHKDYLIGDYHDSNPNYLRAISDADQQVGNALEALKRQGRLDNAILVILSDHGEDFDMDKDQLKNEDNKTVWGVVRGHGGSAIRSAQIQVLLGFKRFGAAPFDARDIDFPASLVDIAPTLSELAQLQERANSFDGTSLANLLNGSRPDSDHKSRTRFVESSFLPVAVTKKEIDEREVLKEERGRYEITPFGHIRVRHDFIAHHLENRERAVYKDDWGLGIPKDTMSELIVLRRSTNTWWPLSSAPPIAPTAELLAKACSHWHGDHVTLLQTHCSSGNALSAIH